jgi:putative transposase
MAAMSILRLVVTFLGSLFKSQRQLAFENLALRQQVTMLRQSVKRPRATPTDKLFWIFFYRYVDGWRTTLHALHPDTVVRWHRQGFRLYWRWKSRGPKPGRPAIDTVLRKLIRDMQATNIGWGAPRIHGELLKLGIEVSLATVSKYMLHPNKPPSQTWRTFLSNHVECLAAIDFFTGAPAAVPTARFRVLYVFIVLSHDRRQVVHFNVTEHPTAPWTAQQLVEAFPLESAPRVCCEIEMLFMVKLSNNESRALVSRGLSRRLARHGKIPSLNELSDPYAGIVWIMSLFSMSNTYVEPFANISAITILVERTCR